MRHRAQVKRFSRSPQARKALFKGLVTSLVEHERIKTTVPKAKELRRHVERAITAGRKGDLAATRLLMSRYSNKDTVRKIISDLSVRFKERPGGYTRILKLGNRAGDGACDKKEHDGHCATRRTTLHADGQKPFLKGASDIGV